MAYTYDDFVAAANNAGMMEKFSQQDLVTAQKSPEFGLSMLSLMKDLNVAETEEQRLLATEAANQLRKTYGSYNLDADGNSSYAGSYGGQIQETMDKLGSYGDFNYENQEAYDKLLAGIVNPEPFTYDPETDPRFGAYKKAYLREGDRAAQNAIAQHSAGTGGVPSSFAATAAAQAGNYYAGQLADVIPSLYEDSYNKYLGDMNLKLSGLGALQTDREIANQDYLNRYNMLLTMLGNLQNQDATEYNRYQDDLQLAKQREQEAYEKALQAYGMLGYATPEIAETLGINADLTQKQILALQQAMNSMGQNLAVDGILGKQSMNAYQQLGYMDAWPAYQAMVQAGLIDAQGNYTGPSAAKPTVTYRPGTGTGDAKTKELQQMLQAAGYDISDDGIWGKETAEALAQYEAAQKQQQQQQQQQQPTGGTMTNKVNSIETAVANGASRAEIVASINEDYRNGKISYTQYKYLLQKAPAK